MVCDILNGFFLLTIIQISQKNTLIFNENKNLLVRDKSSHNINCEASELRRLQLLP